MNTIDPRPATVLSETTVIADKQTSAVSWAAIFAGATAAASLSLILVMLGSGLGLASISPWAYDGLSAQGFGIAAIVWTTLTSILASAMGGYIAGRLRVRWLSVHIDEVHFRDTAHGFLAWGVATLVTAGLLTSTIGAIVGAGATAGATLAAGATATAGAAVASSDMGRGRGDPLSSAISYYTDSLMRRSGTEAAAPSPATTTAPLPGETNDTTDASDTAADAMIAPANPSQRTRNYGRRMGSANETSRILGYNLRAGTLDPADADYLARIVADRTGMTQQEARARVDQTYARAQQAMKDAEATAKKAADDARKAASFAALWLFIALLAGAFTASFMATVGGRQRDR
jgi:hypothetical protein